jgi:methyltransferase (TIGR00027 family)
MKSNTPSSTALVIGRSIVFTSVDPVLGNLVPSEFRFYTREFLRAALGSFVVSLYEFLGKLSFARFLVRYLERLTVPGMSVHYILRKRQIDEWLNQVAQSGIKLDQVVVIGAGLDTLGIRFASRWQDIRVFEIDHPATQAVKVDAISLQYVKQPKNYILVPSDLSKSSLESTLASSPDFSFDKNTIFLAEGLFMYLPLDVVGNTIDILEELPKGKSSFIFSYMELDQQGKPGFANQGFLVNHWLALKEEIFAWGSSPKALEDFVVARGFEIERHVTGIDLKSTFLSDPKFSNVVSALGENVVWIKS